MGNKGVYGDTPKTIQPNNSKIINLERAVNEQNKILKEQIQRIDEIIKRIEKIEAKITENKNPLDLNKDGVVDEKDASIAGKVLADRKKKKSIK